MKLFRLNKEESENGKKDILRKEFGKKGEDSAASFLCGKGFTVIGRNVRSGHLETDIIAKNDSFVIFAEVKTRSQVPDRQSLYGRPARAVDREKSNNLIRAAGLWQKEHLSEIDGLMPRIDIIEVYIDPDSSEYKVLKIFHMEDAVHR